MKLNYQVSWPEEKRPENPMRELLLRFARSEQPLARMEMEEQEEKRYCSMESMASAARAIIRAEGLPIGVSCRKGGAYLYRIEPQAGAPATGRRPRRGEHFTPWVKPAGER